VGQAAQGDKWNDGMMVITSKGSGFLEIGNGNGN
jgi:hypothetical protein